jgi:hypothetical protein
MYKLTIKIRFKSLLKGDIVKRRLQFLLENMAPCDVPDIEVSAEEVSE